MTTTTTTTTTTAAAAAATTTTTTTTTVTTTTTTRTPNPPDSGDPKLPQPHVSRSNVSHPQREDTLGCVCSCMGGITQVCSYKIGCVCSQRYHHHNSKPSTARASTCLSHIYLEISYPHTMLKVDESHVPMLVHLGHLHPVSIQVVLSCMTSATLKSRTTSAK